MEISITWNICRVCLQEEQKNNKGSNSDSSTEQMRNLFNENKKLIQHIYEFTGINMQPNDSLPDKICLNCLKIINNAVHFRKTCRASNVYLQSMLERTKSASTLFKPDIPSCVVSDDENDVENMETDATSEVENDIELSKVEKRSKLELFDSPDNAPAIEQKVNQTVQNIDLEQDVEEQEVSDNAIDNTVELEEIIEHSDEMEEQIFTQTIDDSSSDKIIPNVKILKENHEQDPNVDEENEKTKPSQLQKFYMNASFTKVRNTEEDLDDHNDNEHDLAENVESDMHNLKTDSEEELYFLLKDIKNENPNSSDSHENLEETGEQHTVTDENIEYYAIEEHEEIEEEDIDEELMLHLEEQIDDNNAQVSSTVDTNDEIEYHEQNSNTSTLISDFDEEYIVDDNVGAHNESPSSQETIETKSHRNKTLTKSLNASIATERRTSPIILPIRKAKRVQTKSSATRSLPGSQLQVCVCEICGNQFTNRNLMSIHMKVHYQEKNHQCELCFKRFITACNLQAHMRIHTGEKPFECRYCGRRFNDRSSSLRHERTHTNEKPFKCDNCGKTFTLATTLQNHMKVHTNERSYRCEPCGKSFKLSHHLKTHLNTSLHRSVLQIGAPEN
ncbi:zinc finger protein 287-like [Calliphora vicina]|uniref:zinc finger protein 287-like n=1 Tax=Calliphora vicina TaxID=7373 RepID=UPI00325A9A54